MTRPQLSVIIPTYGRAEELPGLLDSIIAQEHDDWEIVVAEDHSPRRDLVRQTLAPYQARLGARLRYHENEETLGYDANFRNLIALARGEYVFVMGDDDRVATGAFAAVREAIRKYPNLGVIIRAYTVFEGTPENTKKVLRHFPGECVFPAGPHAIVAAHRALVAMAGIVMHRDLAQKAASEEFDGSLFYQQWLAANILVERDAVYIPTILAHFRHASPPIFGTAKREKGLYTPGIQPPDTDLKMIGNLMRIAEVVQAQRGVEIVDHVRRDFANHMYPTIAHQAHQPWPVFFKFYRDLGRLGFRRYPQYHVWFWMVAIFGPRVLNRGVALVRRVLGHTPNFTRFARQARRPTPA